MNTREEEGPNMFGSKRKAPTKPFTHAEDCPILKADPSVEIPWSYLGDGFWRAECVCSFESFTESIVDTRERLDPLDPKTSRHMGECEFVSETDPPVLKILLKVTDKGDYDWVECGSCAAGWQTSHFESVGDDEPAAAPAPRLRDFARRPVALSPVKVASSAARGASDLPTEVP